MSGWLTRARHAADCAPLRERVPLHLQEVAGAVEIGSIEPVLAETMRAAGLDIAPFGNCYRIGAPADRSLERIARWLHEQHLCAPWRGELLDVTAADCRVVSAVERAAVRVLGIRTRAVHLTGRDADGSHAWVQQRAFTKATDPGLWDTLMGGQVAAGESVESTLARETMEEAGLEIGMLVDVQRAASLNIRRPVAEGYVVEDIDVFRAVVPVGVLPVNRDGEVMRFECLAEHELIARLGAGDFTLEASLILGAELEHRDDVRR